MSKLSTLLERAFENKGNKNYYSSQPYSVSFEERTWETLSTNITNMIFIELPHSTTQEYRFFQMFMENSPV